MNWRVAIDIGGAFTDLLAIDQDTGEQVWTKLESTPGNYAEGVINSLTRSSLPGNKIGFVIHGQTVVINTIVTRAGSKVGLITTDGFDTLEIGRANRRDIFSLRYKKPESFVPRYLIAGVKERMLASGEVLTPLDEEGVRNGVRKLVASGAESIVIAFINSYANPDHEKRANEIVADELRRLGREPFITLSHELTREWREYERFSTAVLNSYVQSKFSAYLNQIESSLNDLGFHGTFYIMLANAGMSVSGFAKRNPIFSIEGGPVGGVVGGIALAKFLGEKDIIVLDGGSTTTKASLVRDLSPKITTDYYVNRGRFEAGYPVRVPVVEVVEVGNGGTSIIWLDETKRLKVGPKAAGAFPGPACYKKGGREPTLTDAYVVAGYLNPQYLLGGELKIDASLARDSLKEIAENFKVSVEEAADAAIRIANDQAAYVIRAVSVQKGYDTREFVLIAHGGSGPMFAPFLAEELQIPKVIVPPIPPGVFNAWGMLLADIRHDLVQTFIVGLTADSREAKGVINRVFKEMEDRVTQMFVSEGIKDPIVLERYADMRYYGQEHAIKVALPNGAYTSEDIKTIETSFIKAHEREYGFTLPGNKIEVVSFHVVGFSRVAKPKLPELDSKAGSLASAQIGERDVYVGKEGWRKVPIYKKELLPKDKPIKGQAIIEEKTSTILVNQSFKAQMDKYGSVIIGVQ